MNRKDENSDENWGWIIVIVFGLINLIHFTEDSSRLAQAIGSSLGHAFFSSLANANSTEIVTLLLIGFIFLLVILLIREVQKQQSSKARYRRVPVISHKRTFQAKRTLPLNHPLRIKLLAMVGGSVATADRLLSQSQKSNPGMETEWYFDKVIYDLERDRR